MRRRLACLSWLFVPAVVLLSGSITVSAPLMVEKNLFAEDRKPPSPDQAPEAPRSNSPGLSAKAIQLDGVFIYGDTKKALLRLKGQAPGRPRVKGEQSPYVFVKEGEKVADYEVVKIEPKSISLQKDGQVVVVNLYAEGKISPPVPAPPPNPAEIAAPPGGQGFQPQGEQAAGGPVRPARPGMPPLPPPGANPPGVTAPPPLPEAQVVAPETENAGNEAPQEEEEQVEEEPPEEPAQ